MQAKLYNYMKRAVRLGFSDEIKIGKHNIKLCDTLKYAKEGNLKEKLKSLFLETN